MDLNQSHKFRRRCNSGGYTTSSPIFYSIPWNPLDFSSSGLGPGQSVITDRMNGQLPWPGGNCGQGHGGELDYSKAGFTYFHHKKCTCGFLSEYRKQFNRRTFQTAHPNHKPWWNGRELTSKFDPKYPCYPMHIEGLSTYTKDYRGAGAPAAQLCYPEGEIEKAQRILAPRGVYCHFPHHDYNHNQNQNNNHNHNNNQNHNQWSKC